MTARTGCLPWALLMAAALLGAGGCGRESDPAATTDGPETSRGTIGLSVLTLQNPFFQVIADSMRDEAARHGYEVMVVSGELDPAAQDNQVNDFIVRGVSAIVLTPCDSEAIGQAISRATNAGIPVFTADIACTADDARDLVVTHVATNNYLGGRLAARAMIEALDNEGKVAVLSHPTVESALERVRGFHDELAEQQSPIQVVGEWAGLGTRDASLNVAQEVLQAHPDLAGFFCINDPSALGARAALEIANKTDQVTLVGFDGQPEGKLAIRDGKIFADPIQFPDRIGRETVRAIIAYFEGGDVPEEILIEPELYYQADAMEDPELADL